MAYIKEPPKRLPPGTQWVPIGTFEFRDPGGNVWLIKQRQELRFIKTGAPVIDPKDGRPIKQYIQTWPGYDKKPAHAPSLLYNIEQVRKAISSGEPINLFEGEPKCELGRQWGLVCTCNEFGAGNWTMEHAKLLMGPNANIIIHADNDEAGRLHADDIGRSLINHVKSLKLMELPHLPEHGDIIDWALNGGSKELFDKLDKLPWKPYLPPRRRKDEFNVICAEEAGVGIVDWFWNGFIARGDVTVFFGPPEHSKSTLAMHFAALSTIGGEWPCDGGVAPMGRWLVLSAEDDWRTTINPRIIANGGDWKKVFRLNLNNRWFDLSKDIQALKTTIEKMEDVIGLVIDPVSAFLGKPGKVDSHKQADVRGILGPLHEMATELNIVIIAIMHPNKSLEGASVLAAIAGSSAFGEAPRVVHLIIPDPDDENRVLMLRAKNSHMPRTVTTGMAYRLVNTEIEPGINAAKIMWDGPVDISAREALKAYARPEKDRRGAKEVQDWLRALLLAGPMDVKKIREEADKIGISKDQLDRAKQKLGVISRKIGMSDGFEWLLGGDGGGVI